MKTIDCKTIEYSKAWELQRELFEKVRQDQEPSTLLLCEHPHVYTLGKSGHTENLLVNADFLQKIGATYFKTDRGGDITYHGPGQLVAYPIINLATLKISLRQYIYLLEQTVIDTLESFNITAERLDSATGVWIIDTSPRKICAIGVRASRNTTMHGLALNIATDLSYFQHINPCGFTDKGVTSIAKENNTSTNPQELMCRVKEVFVQNFNRLFKTE